MYIADMQWNEKHASSICYSGECEATGRLYIFIPAFSFFSRIEHGMRSMRASGIRMNQPSLDHLVTSRCPQTSTMGLSKHAPRVHRHATSHVAAWIHAIHILEGVGVVRLG